MQRARAEVPPKQDFVTLAPPFLDVMALDPALPICDLIAQLPFQWAPPKTSSDPLCEEHSHFKRMSNYLRRPGLVTSSQVRIRLYGMLPHCKYGIRTHPAEETYIMLAGSVLWKVVDAPYQQLFPGEKSHHPSMAPHATRTGEDAFMSIYIWDGDIATDQYRYFGLPDDEASVG